MKMIITRGKLELVFILSCDMMLKYVSLKVFPTLEVTDMDVNLKCCES